MSMMNRLMRAFETASNFELNEQERGGMRGENNAEYFIDDGQNGCYIRNPIIPHPRKAGIYFETDFLVYMQGTMYCVEIKNFRGKVYYPARYRTELVRKGWFIFKRTVQQQVVDGYDYSKMVQEKMGYKGEGLVKREFPNPFLKTREYIEDLKQYLHKIEPRLLALPIYPVVGFARQTNIDAVYNFESGIMHVEELPKFFERYKNLNFDHRPSPWIQQALHKLPTWDKIQTTGNEWINGTITDQAFTFKDTDGRTQTLPYNTIQRLDLKRSGSFSAYDDLTITYTNGSRKDFRCTSGEIHLSRFKGEMQTHKLRNVNCVAIGVANKRI